MGHHICMQFFSGPSILSHFLHYSDHYSTLDKHRKLMVILPSILTNHSSHLDHMLKCRSHSSHQTVLGNNFKYRRPVHIWVDGSEMSSMFCHGLFWNKNKQTFQNNSKQNQVLEDIITKALKLSVQNDIWIYLNY